MCERRDSSHTCGPDVRRIEQIVNSGANVRDSIRETRLARMVYEIHTEGAEEKNQRKFEVGQIFGSASKNEQQTENTRPRCKFTIDIA